MVADRATGPESRSRRGRASRFRSLDASPQGGLLRKTRLLATLQPPRRWPPRLHRVIVHFLLSNHVFAHQQPHALAARAIVDRDYPRSALMYPLRCAGFVRVHVRVLLREIRFA